MKELNILHATNVKLGKYFPEFGVKGKDVRKIIREIFVTIIKDEIKNRNIDLLIITSNLFGVNMYSSADATAAIDLFSEIEIPVLIMPGELDEFNEISIYNKLDFSDNVYVFKDISDIYTLPGHDDVMFSVSKDPLSFNPGIKVVFKENDYEYGFYSSTGKFSETNNAVFTPSLSICEGEEHVMPGYTFVHLLTDGNTKAEFIRDNSINKNDIQIIVTKLRKRDLENTIREHSGKYSILNIELIGKIDSIDVLSEVYKVYERNKEDFLLLKIIDNTILSEEYIRSLPTHLEPAIFVNMVNEMMKSNPEKKELYKNILKRGIYYYNT